MVEEVILVNEQDEEIGVMEKMEAHKQAKLHRAFSIFLFNKNGEMLLQQRAFSKYHSAGLWTNACCSHPRPGETTINAAERRLKEELGIAASIRNVFNFTYKAAFDNGLTEHEFDHVFVGNFDGVLFTNPNEVESTRYLPMEQLTMQLQQEPAKFTAWFHIAFPKIYEWWKSTQQ